MTGLKIWPFLGLFWFPFFGDFYLALGICDIYKDSIRHICTKEKSGRAAVLVLGGAEESPDARPGSCKVFLNRRKGFIRMVV